MKLRFQTTILFVTLTFLITLGLAVSLQEVFGINIGSDLNFALTGKKITGLPVPVASSDAATRGYVDSVATGFSWNASCVMVTESTPTFCNVTASCPANYKVTGGGCATGSATVTQNFPLSVSSWFCGGNTAPEGCTVYAICCKQ